MDYPIRPISFDEMDEFFSANASSFGWNFDPERMEGIRKLIEIDRTTSVWDGKQVVGTAGIWSFETTVPGGMLPTAGVTWVSVRPTHRRRGILNAMMRTQLEAVHERGEPLATLWASESVIYGRYGYGCAAEGAELKIARERARFAEPKSVAGQCRFVDRDTALGAWPAVHDAARRVQPGMHSRSSAWWEHRLFAVPDRRPVEGFSNNFNVQYEDTGQVMGYVRYRIRGQETNGLPDGIVRVTELTALSDDAYRALWEFVFGVDLIGEIVAPWRRVEEPLTWMLADPRQLLRRVHDTLWVRLVDVPAALAGRRYLGEGELVIQVVDDFCAWNSGRYLLKGGPDGATCVATSKEPDVTLAARDLGAVYLGGVRMRTLVSAGRVEASQAALRRADGMFRWDTAPWEMEVF